MTPRLVLPIAIVCGLLGLGWMTAPAGAGTPAPATSPTAGTYLIDAGHSVVLFRTRHFQVSYFHGRFNQVAGELTYDAESPSQSSIRVVVDAKSVDSNSGNRDEHLMSPDFLSAEEFPEIVFESKSVAAEGENLRVTGDFTLHGKTKEITVDVVKVGEGTTPRGDYRIGFETVFEIDPKEFGIAYMQNSDMLGPEIRITVALEAILSE